LLREDSIYKYNIAMGYIENEASCVRVPESIFGLGYTSDGL
jgi:hypothetical protein